MIFGELNNAVFMTGYIFIIIIINACAISV